MTNVDNDIEICTSSPINDSKKEDNAELENIIQEKNSEEKKTFDSNPDISDKLMTKGNQSFKYTTYTNKKDKLENLTSMDTNVSNSDKHIIKDATKEESSESTCNPFFGDKVDEDEVIFSFYYTQNFFTYI